jgi:tetratricopeptide (TPR) repeat protein
MGKRDPTPEDKLKEGRKLIASSKSGSWLPWANKASDAEDGATLIHEAAEGLKGRGELKRAAEMYEEASAAFAEDAGDKSSGARAMNEAVKLYKAIPLPEDYTRCMQQGVQLSNEAGNFRLANTFNENLGNEYELRGELPKAMEYFLAAAKGYQVEGQTTTANRTTERAADLLAQTASTPADYHKARDYYLNIAASNIQSRTLKFSVKNYLFKAGCKSISPLRTNRN